MIYSFAMPSWRAIGRRITGSGAPTSASLAEAEDVAARTRNPGALADDETLFEFYDDRIPADIVSTRHFDRWWKSARLATPDLLTLTLEELLPGEHNTAGFPETWIQGDATLPLSYQFEPGSAGDGVTVHVPLALLPSLRPDGFDWLVPGLRLELVTATIRALPKHVRRLLVPAPDVARAIDAALTLNGEDFHAAFSRAAQLLRDVEIPADAWDGVEDRLPAHLRVTFRVESDGAVVGEGPDLAYLQRELAPSAQRAVAAAVGAGVSNAAAPQPPSARPTPAPTSAPAGEPLTAWPRDLEDVIEGSGGVRGYPAVVDMAGTPTLTVLALPDADAHARGVRRLLLTELALPAKRITTRWTGAEALALGASPYPSTDALVADLQLAAVTALTPEAATIRTSDAYAAARSRVREELETEVHRIAGLAIAALAAARDLDGEIRAATSLALLSTVSEARNQSNSLVGDGFIAAISTQPPAPRAAIPQRASASARGGGRKPEPRRRARVAGARGRGRVGCLWLPRRRSLDDRGTAGVAVRPAARHRRHRQRAADSKGARREFGTADERILGMNENT